MRRASEASLFFLGFRRKKKPLHNGSYEHRVPKIKNKTFFCMYVRVIQHRNWPLRSTILNAHGTNAVLTGSVHAHILTRPSRAGFAVSHLELNEPGAATCVWRHGWAVFKKLGTYVPGKSTSIIYHNVFFLSGKKAAERGLSQQLYLQVGRPCP